LLEANLLSLCGSPPRWRPDWLLRARVGTWTHTELRMQSVTPVRRGAPRAVRYAWRSGRSGHGAAVGWIVLSPIGDQPRKRVGRVAWRLVQEPARGRADRSVR
jgi:hypothetical protein